MKFSPGQASVSSRDASNFFSCPVFRGGRRAGFSLLELLVTMAVLSIFVVLLFSVTDNSFKLWRSTSADISMFDSARAAFDTMTRRISQATLNTYLDYYDSSWQRRNPSNAASFTPAKYGRASDLAFLSGTARDIFKGSVQGHAIAFFAPLGYVAANRTLADLPNLLNPIGYHVEWGSDANLRPGFLSTLPAKNRFRLIERIVPSQNFTGYPSLTDTDDNNDSTWITDSTNGLDGTNAVKNVLGENIIALIIRPEVTQEDAKLLDLTAPEDITADYFYDSRAGEARTSDPEALQFAQLPPMLRVVMVAVSEKDAAKLIGNNSTAPDAFTLDSSLFSDPAKLNDDLDALSRKLTDANVQFRIFNQVIPLRAAKFSAQKEK